VKAIHANCPRCGAAILLEGERRLSRCEFCGSKVLVEVKDAVPTYWFKPVLDRESAKRTVFRALDDSAMPSDIRRHALPESFSLAFVPFYVFSGKRVGLLTTNDAAEAITGSRDSGFLSMTFVHRTMLNPAEGVTGLAEHMGIDPPVVDSKVLYNSFSTSGIATDLPGWGLDKLNVDAILESNAASREIYSAAELQKLGEVYEVTRSSERFISEKTRIAETKEVSVKLKILAESTAVHYHPVWLCRYSYRGMVYKATVDAMTGTLLLLRAPQSDRMRLPVMLAILAALAWPASKLAAYVARSNRPGAYATAIGSLMMFAWPLTMTIALVVLLVLYLSWMNYRYPGELVITPDRREVEKVGKPAESWVDRLFEKLDVYFQEMIKASARRRGL
jgi:DNA-directed RNA polymerase subunit RPC12/RpoP